MATIAVSVLAPKTAANMIASSSAGNASSRSLARMSTSPSHRGAIAGEDAERDADHRGDADRDEADEQRGPRARP